MNRRVLIFSVDSIPLAGQPVAGGGLRAWTLGEGLRHQGHEVHYALPSRVLERMDDPPAELLDAAFEDATALDEVVHRLDPDVVLFEQWGLLDHFEDEGVPVVVDLHGSLLLENAYRGQVNWTASAAAKLSAFSKADLVVVPGQRQADYFKPWLLLAGGDPRTLPVVTIPVSMPPDLPPRGGASPGEGPRFVHGGQLWPWIDPFPALSILVETLEAESRGVLDLFIAAPVRRGIVPLEPPLPSRDLGKIEALAQSERVHLHGRLGRDELIARYLQSDVAVDVYGRNAERELAFTTRTVEYLWCGVPVVYSDYQELSEHLSSSGAGWTVDPCDEEGLRDLFQRLLREPDLLQEASLNARSLVQDRFTWDRTTGPLAEFVANPRRRGRGRTLLSRMDAEARTQEKTWREERDRLHTMLEDRTRDIARLSFELTARDADIRSREEDLRRARRQLEDAKARHEEIILQEREEVRRLTRRLEDRDDEIRSLQKEKVHECAWRDEEIRRREVQVRTESQRLEQRISDLSREMRDEVHWRDEKLRDQERQLSRLQEKLDSMVERWDERMENARRGFETTEHILETRLSETESERERLSCLSSELQTRVHQLEEERESLAAQVETRDRQLGELPGEMEKHRLEVRLLRWDLAQRDRRIQWLEEVTRSYRHHVLARFAATAAFRLRRWFVQWPLLLSLCALESVRERHARAVERSLSALSSYEVEGMGTAHGTPRGLAGTAGARAVER